MKFKDMYKSKLILDTISNRQLREWVIDLWDKNHPFYLKHIHDKVIADEMTEKELLMLQFRFKTTKGGRR